MRHLGVSIMASGHPHGYEYDLFVSYSTRDLAWVRQFHDDLVEDINRFAEFDVFPFLDKARLQPGYVWHEKLLAAASDSAILVPVLSPRFFESDYCQKEVRAFVDAHGLTSGSAHRSRIVPVKLLCAAPKGHVLASPQAAIFCTEGDDGIPYEHEPGTAEYKGALRKLAYAIAQVIKTLPSKQQRRPAVYLAPDFRPASEKLRASLEHHFDVLPEKPADLPGLSPEELAQSLERDFARCFASVHPLSEAPFRQAADRVAARVRPEAKQAPPGVESRTARPPDQCGFRVVHVSGRDRGPPPAPPREASRSQVRRRRSADLFPLSGPRKQDARRTTARCARAAWPPPVSVSSRRPRRSGCADAYVGAGRAGWLPDLLRRRLPRLVRRGVPARPEEDPPAPAYECDFPRAAAHTPQDARPAEPRCAGRGRGRSRDRGVPGSRAMSAAAIETRPYIGLRYFEEHDAHLFYGRDEHVAELLGKLAENRFVAVMGSSGCGKSSLVRAGLLPELRSGMIPKAGPQWKVVEFKPGRAPLGELSDAIRSKLSVEKARELVEEGPLGIARAVAEANLDEGTNVLIIADQFEELFRFQREELSQGRGPEAVEQCRALVRRLLDAAAQPELPIYVLLVVRSDYLGECAQFPDLPERMSGSLYLVPRLRRDQLQEAITAPVGGDIEPAVVQRLLSEVGNDPDQLPRLQHLLGRMWDRAGGGRLTMDHYKEAGGWEKGLEQDLEEVYDLLGPLQQWVCRRVFQQLSELDKGRAVRRRAEIEDLERVCGPKAATVVEEFRREGFVLPQSSPVDITHECVLRGWGRLREWLADEERARVFYRELVERKDRPGRLHASDLREVGQRRRAGQFNENWARRYGTEDEFVASRPTCAEADGRGMRRGSEWACWWPRWPRWGSTRCGPRSSREAAASRARELTAHAALSQSEDPARALYLGLRAGEMARPLPPGLEQVLATALTNGASYAALRDHVQRCLPLPGARMGRRWRPRVTTRRSGCGRRPAVNRSALCKAIKIL